MDKIIIKTYNAFTKHLAEEERVIYKSLGGFCLHKPSDSAMRQLNTGWYTVTHINSGVAVGTYQGARRALDALKYFSEFEVMGRLFGPLDMCDAVALAPFAKPEKKYAPDYMSGNYAMGVICE